MAIDDAALLNVVREAGEGVLVLLEYVDEEEYGRSRLTRKEVQRQLLIMARALGGLSSEARQAMPEIDWEAWRAFESNAAPAAPDSWFTARSLVPATLLWLRVYRQSAPALFEFRL